MVGFISPNHTQTPNDLFDVYMPDMGECELKVTLAIIRKTLGYHKIQDPISLSQLQTLTGLSRQGVIDGVELAISRGLVEIVGTGKRGVQIFGLVINSDQSTKLTSPADDWSKIQTGTGQQNRLTKDNNQKKKESKETPPKHHKYPDQLKNWTYKDIDAYALEHIDINSLIAVDGMHSKIGEFATAAGREIIELHQEVTRLNIPVDNWSELYKMAVAIDRPVSIYRRMMWCVQDWLNGKRPAKPQPKGEAYRPYVHETIPDAVPMPEEARQAMQKLFDQMNARD